MSNELKIRIIKDSLGNNLDLNNISIEAADALKVFIDSFTNLAKTYSNTSDINLRLDNGSITACLVLPEEDEHIVNDLEEVFTNKSRNNSRIKILKTIQDKIQLNGSEYEVYFKKSNLDEINITQIFKGTKFQTRKQRLTRVYSTEFIEGVLFEVGGKTNANVHVENEENGQTYTIGCERNDAKILNKRLYSKVYLSTRKIETQKELKYEYIDNYLDSELYSFYKSLHNELVTNDSIEKYDLIHDYIYQILNDDNRSNEELIKIIKLYNNDYIEKGILRTILMSLKPIINREIGLLPHYNSLAEKLRSRSKTGKI
ncbi:hypothetical protein [uncultured Chryseobacterium sp.]|uniref:hypothetical protein n=1 Tax=uncultured Chryseobacterium sp. TaxID=259322 RepID=UPI0037487E92